MPDKNDYLNQKFVIRAGALGSSALMYLAATGVGTLGIVDFDKVELSNLQRQFIHWTNTVGMNKTISAKKALSVLSIGRIQ